ncbi:hypothetical protein D3C86_450260 [compost metagenome]
MVGLVQRGQLLHRQGLAQAVDEVHPLLGAPLAADLHVGQGVAALPGDARGVDDGEVARACLGGERRDARLVQPCLQLGVGDRARLPGQQVLLEVLDELVGVRALEGVVIEPAAQERIEGIAAKALFQELQEPRALDVGNLAQRFVGVTFAQRRQRQGLVGRAHVLHLGEQIVLVDLALHLGHLLAVQRLGDAALHVGGETFVEPDVLPAGVGHQVARPAVRQLMGHQGDQRLVAHDHGRGGEGQARVLHAAERERRRQHQHVVTTPAVLAVELLGRTDHLLGVFELLGGLADHGRLGPHAGAAGDRLEHQVTGGDGQQVGGDRLRHLEGVVTVTRGLGIVVGAHQHHHVRARDHVRAVGEAHARGVLQRHPRTGVDGLGLAEHEGQLLALGHRRLQPLQARGGRGGVVGDLDLGRLLRGLDAQLAAEHLVGRGQHELQRGGLAVRADRLDLLHAQLTGVQHQLLGRLVLPLQGVGRGAADLLAVEIQLQVQRQVLDHHLVRLGVGALVVAAAVGVHGSFRRCGGGGRGGGRRRVFRAAGGQRHGQGNQQERRSHGHRDRSG